MKAPPKSIGLFQSFSTLANYFRAHQEGGNRTGFYPTLLSEHQRMLSPLWLFREVGKATAQSRQRAIRLPKEPSSSSLSFLPLHAPEFTKPSLCCHFHFSSLLLLKFKLQKFMKRRAQPTIRNSSHNHAAQLASRF